MGLVVARGARAASGSARSIWRWSCEELGRVARRDRSSSTQLVIAAIAQAGTAAQRKTWLPQLVAGETFGALAYLEDERPPRSRRHPDDREADARRLSTLGGGKLFALEAPGADVLLVAARTQRGTGPGGVSLFLVERTAPGVRVRGHETIDVTRRVGEVTLRDVALPAEALLGRAGQGWPLLSRAPRPRLRRHRRRQPGRRRAGAARWPSSTR